MAAADVGRDAAAAVQAARTLSGLIATLMASFTNGHVQRGRGRLQLARLPYGSGAAA